MLFFYQPLQPYPQTSGIQQGFQSANSENNFVQNTNLYNNVPLGGQKVGSESSSTITWITSTTKTSVSGLNAGESWSNFDTLVTAAVNCDDQKLLEWTFLSRCKFCLVYIRKDNRSTSRVLICSCSISVELEQNVLILLVYYVLLNVYVLWIWLTRRYTAAGYVPYNKNL